MKHSFLALTQKAYGSPLFSVSSGSPDTVYISLPSAREIIVYHEIDLIEIDSPGRNISGNQKTESASAEGIHCF